MDTSVPEVICLRSFLMPPQALPILPRVCERLIGGAALRSVLIVLLPSLVPAAEASPVPTGHDLFKLPVGKFRAYVAGIVEGQQRGPLGRQVRPLPQLRLEAQMATAFLEEPVPDSIRGRR